jgi:hypothetical protein
MKRLFPAMLGPWLVRSLRGMGLTLALGTLVAGMPGALAAPRIIEDEGAFDLDTGCRQLAEAVSLVIEQDNLPKSVVVGSFQGLPRLASSGGVGLAHRVTRALEAIGIAVGPSGAVQLTGRFSDAVAHRDPSDTASPANHEVALRVEYTLLDQRDAEIAKGVINVFGDGPLEIAGGTADLRGDGVDDEGRGQRHRDAIEEAFRRPLVFIDRSETRPRADSPFGVEVLVAGKPRVPTVRDGRAYVTLAKGDAYRVRVRNGTAATVLVSLTIDGLDAFTFSEDPGDKGRKVHFVLKPHTRLDVPGWFITKKRSDEFRITDYARSEAVKLHGLNEAVGQVTATFYVAAAPWASTKAEVGERIGTERGNAVETDYRRIPFREGEALATITVRYEKKP